MSRKTLIITTLFSIAAVGAFYFFWKFYGISSPNASSKIQQVEYLEIEPKPRPYVRELPGRITPTRVAEVRARVAGIVLSRKFEQGSDVTEGDALYQIDQTVYEVELKAAQAALQKAEAILERDQRQAQRTEELTQNQAVAISQYEIAKANLFQAKADVEARKADVARAELNLSYTTVRAPISGRIGRALVTEGALVRQDEATHLATIQQLDPIYADFTQSFEELNKLRRALASGDLEAAGHESAKVRLLLDNDIRYNHEGSLLFSDANVDPSTGKVTLRGVFPNPNKELLPGMYVRVQIQQGIDPDSIAVPQQAVRRNEAGLSEVYILDADNRVGAQIVELGFVVDNYWLISRGLKRGDRVIVEGFQKFQLGDIVDPKPWSSDKNKNQKADLILNNNSLYE